MAFTDYKSISMVLEKFRIRYEERHVIRPSPFEIHPYFLEDFLFARHHIEVRISEYSICETIVYPILKEVYKRYTDVFALWSHKPIYYSEDLSGVPDYLFAMKSALGRVVMGHPILIVIEAKRNDFIEGWGQCVAAMLAAQKLHGDPTFPVYGVVTDGEVWRFGVLLEEVFTEHTTFYTLNDLGGLFGALNAVLEDLKEQSAQRGVGARV